MKHAETQFITNILRNPGGARFVIEGDIGVGKTSFVNYRRALWEQSAGDKLFTPEEEISVSTGWNVKDFLLNILAVLIEKLSKKFDLTSSDRILEEIALLSKVHRESNHQYGASLFGFGASLGRDTTLHVPFVPETQLIRYFRYLVAKIRSFGYSGVFIHLDNLELLNEDETIFNPRPKFYSKRICPKC